MADQIDILKKMIEEMDESPLKKKLLDQMKKVLRSCEICGKMSIDTC